MLPCTRQNRAKIYKHQILSILLEQKFPNSMHANKVRTLPRSIILAEIIKEQNKRSFPIEAVNLYNPEKETKLNNLYDVPRMLEE